MFHYLGLLQNTESHLIHKFFTWRNFQHPREDSTCCCESLRGSLHQQGTLYRVTIKSSSIQVRELQRRLFRDVSPYNPVSTYASESCTASIFRAESESSKKQSKLFGEKQTAALTFCSLQGAFTQTERFPQTQKLLVFLYTSRLSVGNKSWSPSVLHIQWGLLEQGIGPWLGLHLHDKKNCLPRSVPRVDFEPRSPVFDQPILVLTYYNMPMKMSKRWDLTNSVALIRERNI
jgi:hypothetical protein